MNVIYDELMQAFEHDLVKALLDMLYSGKLITSKELTEIEQVYWISQEGK